METDTPSSRREGGRQRLRWFAAAMGLKALTAVTDIVPPRYRFGHWTRLMDLLSFGEQLPVLEFREMQNTGPASASASAVSTSHPRRVTCMVLAGGLDSGGIEAVVGSLARGLPAHGIDVEVVGTSGGRIEKMLLEAGVAVSIMPSSHVADHLEHRQPDVIQLHRIDPSLLRALDAWAPRVVPVFHAMESYLTRAVWVELASLLARTGARISVSSSVREYFEHRAGADSWVVENGVVPVPSCVMAKDEARTLVGQALGVRLDAGDVIVAGLQRFSDQKNPAGLVDAFLRAAEQDVRLRLIIAGGVNSWLELRRADVVRRRHKLGHRVHFLGDSDPSVLMSSADIFALDSFSEGGPIAALDALNHGLPIVISEVGFARELVAGCSNGAILVPRANRDFSQRAMAQQRRRSHQSNREAFASALLGIAREPFDGQRTQLPPDFVEAAMVGRHARILRDVAQSC